MKRLNAKRALGLAVLYLGFLFFGRTFFYPVQLFVTLVHEMSHGLAALLTGGSVLKIEVHPDLGGLCFTSGGWNWLIAMAGYLGSTLFGAGVLLVACRTRFDRALSCLIGAGLLVLTALYVRTSTGLLGGAAFGATLLLAGWRLSEEFNDILLSFLGLASLSYALFDIRILLTSSVIKVSDAQLLSKIIPLPPILWAGLWFVFSMAVAFWAVGASILRGRGGRD